mgnify:CR=1 FL=1
MALKLMLLSGEVVENINEKDFDKFKIQNKSKVFSLTEEQHAALDNLNDKNLYLIQI